MGKGQGRGHAEVIKLFLVCIISVGFLSACSFSSRDCAYCVFKKNSDEKVWTMFSVDGTNS